MCYSICEVMHMLFKRKIYNKFLAWKQEANGQKALLVEGARRIGKSTVVEEFAKNEYKSYILIDFAKAPENVKSYFQLHLNDLDTFYMLLSVQYGVQLYPRESAIIFDEVQLFPKAREAIKYLVADGRYDFIETGFFDLNQRKCKGYCDSFRRTASQDVPAGF